MLASWNDIYIETKETRHFVMKMKTWFKVIVNSNEEKSRKSSNEIMRKKKTKEGLAKKETRKPYLQIALTKTTLFQNRRNER